MMKTRKLGNTNVYLSCIGLGAMPLSIKKERPSEEEAIRVIHRAFELGINFIDTADSYCWDESDKHHNEKIIGKALRTYTVYPSPSWGEGVPRSGTGEGERIFIATKGGLMRPKGQWICNGNPEHLWKTINQSVEALGRPIDLWQFHAPDSDYAIEKSLAPAVKAQEQKLIRFIGVSNFSVDEIKEAQSQAPIVSVQNQYNLWNRDPETDGVLQYCEENNLTFLPWSPLGGMGRAKSSPVDVKVVIAWMLQKSSCIIPIPGASQLRTLEDTVRAVDLKLTAEELKKVEA